ncbi:MAG: hypothetical protein AVDCRST_MAG55-2527 [uncultured Rubrobacteraceae bacterium]|uniref:Tetracyclin repressor-like C-terminal domain-containing protein n=1 Tax=uncultured Rubrobacteraceae bacterium TaxID=349277 RepID=A0A6J4Q6F7_9ACTN|nr:MAG: hypothetical protein AVDCRST_MAG55-2527 [uncultured Rubrobacteraceae bacterium]
MERGLAPLAGTGDRAAAAGVLTDAFVARPRLCRLLRVLQSVLEQNVSRKVIADVKGEVLGLSQLSARALHARRWHVARGSPGAQRGLGPRPGGVSGAQAKHGAGSKKGGAGHVARPPRGTRWAARRVVRVPATR